MPNFDELVSIRNDFNQNLAILVFGYPKSLRRLVEWEIDLTIAGVNGLTALHCAYREGEKTVIELLLNAEAPENVVGVLGRIPAHLMHNEFEASERAFTALCAPAIGSEWTSNGSPSQIHSHVQIDLSFLGLNCSSLGTAQDPPTSN